MLLFSSLVLHARYRRCTRCRWEWRQRGRYSINSSPWIGPFFTQIGVLCKLCGDVYVPNTKKTRCLTRPRVVACSWPHFLSRGCWTAPVRASRSIARPPTLVPPQEPWNPASFNFYKASPLEFVLSYTPSFKHDLDEAAAAVAAASAERAGVIPVEMDAAAGVAAAAAAGVGAGEAKAATLGALRGAGDKLNLGAPAADGLDGDFPLGCAEVSTTAPPQDAVLVNIRPVGPVSLLLTPGCVNMLVLVLPLFFRGSGAEEKGFQGYDWGTCGVYVVAGMCVWFDLLGYKFGCLNVLCFVYIW